MSDSEKEENEKEKPYPKDSQVQGEEEEEQEQNEFPNKANDINNNDENNFPEEDNNGENGKKQSKNNSDLENNNNDFNENKINDNEQENKDEENLQDNTFPEKDDNNINDLIEPDNQDNINENNNNIKNEGNEDGKNDFNNDNDFKDENDENRNKESIFRFSKEQNSKEDSKGPLNLSIKDNEFEYEPDNKAQEENNNTFNNNNNSFGFRDSDLKDNNNNNDFNNNQYNNDTNNVNNKNGYQNNNFNDNIRNSGNSDNMNFNNKNNEEEFPNKFNNYNPYTDNNTNNNKNNNFNYVKNPYESINNNTNNKNYLNNPYNNNNYNNNYNNNNNYNYNNYSNNNYNSNNNNRNPNGGFGYSPSQNNNQNNQTTSTFIPQEVPITNKLNYNYSSSYPASDTHSKSPDYDPFYERFEQYPEDGDGFDIDPSKEGKDSTRTAGIQIANTIMGAGILSIPLLMSYLGILIGAMFLLFLAICTIYSVYILMRCHQITGKSGYSMFGKITLGVVGSIIVKIIIIVNNMGICICYMRIFGEVFQTILQSFISKNSFLMTNWHNFIWILLGSVIMFFFIFIKNISHLKKVSYLGVIAVLAFTLLMAVLLLYKTIANELDSGVSWRFLFPDCTFPQAFHAIPTVFLAFLFQFNVFPIYYSLQHRGMKSMLRSTKIGVVLSLVIFLVVGIVGFLLYGFFDNYDDENYQEVYGHPNNDTATYDTVLDKLNDDMILYKGYNIFVVILIIIICVAFVVTCLASFPILFLSLRDNYINSLVVCRRVRDNDTQHVKITQGNYEKKRTIISKKMLTIITIILYLFMVAIAILIYNLKTLFHIIGTIAGTFIAFILPNVFYIRIVKMSGKNYSLVLPVIILGIGILFFFMSLVMAFFDN